MFTRLGICHRFWQIWETSSVHISIKSHRIAIKIIFLESVLPWLHFEINNLTFGNKVVDQKSGTSVHFRANNCIFVKSTKLCGPISHLIFITAPKTFYIWNQGTKFHNLKQKNSNFAMINFSTFSHFQSLEGLQLT